MSISNRYSPYSFYEVGKHYNPFSNDMISTDNYTSYCENHLNYHEIVCQLALRDDVSSYKDFLFARPEFCNFIKQTRKIVRRDFDNNVSLIPLVYGQDYIAFVRRFLHLEKLIVLESVCCQDHKYFDN